jgi:phosphoribosyl 1,2-cyclic phosphodiesterase
MSWSLRFLGVGNAQAVELGSASAVIERDAQPLLMIDCGQEALTTYRDHYQRMPEAVFITHVHMDHVAGLERLFYHTYFSEQRGKVRLYVPVTVLPYLQQRIAEYPQIIAEGGANWWDAFQLIPVTTSFWHEKVQFEVFPVRHHKPHTAFALRLKGSAVWTGDTRPIPEMLAEYADANEVIAHDCALHGNPSHSGLSDLQREYSPELLARCVLYHYANNADAQTMRNQGMKVATAGEVLTLSAPDASVLL